MNGTEESTVSATLVEILQRLGTIEEFLARLGRYEPILAEATKRMEGASRWRRQSG